MTRFLQSAHNEDERYTARDGVNVARYAMKLLTEKSVDLAQAVHSAVSLVLGDDALRYLK